MHMRDNGNDNAHLTLSHPKIWKSTIFPLPQLPYPVLFSQNHWSWVPTYKDEYGIMSWLLNQTKDD